jgi:hypothetical protein
VKSELESRLFLTAKHALRAHPFEGVSQLNSPFEGGWGDVPGGKEELTQSKSRGHTELHREKIFQSILIYFNLFKILYHDKTRKHK